LWVNYVGETNWSSSAQSEDWRLPYSQTTRLGTDPKASSYILFNIKTGYRFTEDTELSLSAFNLLDDHHREFIAGDEVGRRITGNLTTRF
ncbi:MAG: TonB-dependent receptor, partial [Deltaproteobacteria bacterium]|nr:TonB-dependent receptor [Deltaproteobacteria bacterium]